MSLLKDKDKERKKGGYGCLSSPVLPIGTRLLPFLGSGCPTKYALLHPEGDEFPHKFQCDLGKGSVLRLVRVARGRLALPLTHFAYHGCFKNASK